MNKLKKIMKAILILVFTILSLGLYAQDNEKNNIANLIDNWHKAAADADQKAYFGFIADDGVYIGTDSTEIWSKQEFFEWSKPYFEKGKAWSFTCNSRNIHISDERQFAWFDELLSSGKVTLRGSGVLEKGNAGWKLKHYVLSLPVPNEKFKDVIEIMNSELKEKREREE
jgi:ketosteroid isomerase-like protein